ncbi:MAG: hypothetical protein ACREFI_07705 [Stellaceae bacterium]
MKRDNMRVSGSRWRHLGSAALALAAVAVIGATSITPANADWRDHRGWHHGGGVGFGFSIGGPAYGYYPAYPAYYDYGYGYPYYYGPAYYGPSFSVHVGGR